MAVQQLHYETSDPVAPDATDGSFVEPSQHLLPLFADPDARGGRRWADMFDPDQCEEVDQARLCDLFPSLF
ncbi:hypothetical protein [Sphingomicrobium nitratireducens]|uniref:hypothetical protein n=1 Tax=Sphingomicrobium nitratireducens TaxID=2964666 RepID=UPI002240B5C3|nr:hypothetical protein [Sphingomicrobium nitratireducens]